MLVNLKTESFEKYGVFLFPKNLDIQGFGRTVQSSMPGYHCVWDTLQFTLLTD